MTIFFETERLQIQIPSWDDVDNLNQLQSDQDVMRYVGRGVRTVSEVKMGLQRAIDHQNKHGFSLGSVFLKTNGEFIGRAGLIYLAFNDQQLDIEFGYALLKKFWGLGFATELSRALITYGFTHLSVPKLIGIVHPENQASIHVMEKVGMQVVGHDIYNGMEVVRFEISRSDWQRKQMTKETS